MREVTCIVCHKGKQTHVYTGKYDKHVHKMHSTFMCLWYFVCAYYFCTLLLSILVIVFDLFYHLRSRLLISNQLSYFSFLNINVILLVNYTFSFYFTILPNLLLSLSGSLDGRIGLVLEMLGQLQLHNMVSGFVNCHIIVPLCLYLLIHHTFALLIFFF